MNNAKCSSRRGGGEKSPLSRDASVNKNVTTIESQNSLRVAGKNNDYEIDLDMLRKERIRIARKEKENRVKPRDRNRRLRFKHIKLSRKKNSSIKDVTIVCRTLSFVMT